MTQVAKQQIFLSHAERDVKLAERIEDLLREVSLGTLKIWRSSSIEGILPGEIPWQKIHEELGQAGKVVAVFTPISCTRPWLLYETAYVAGMGHRQVIPLLCGVAKDSIPAPVREYNCYVTTSQTSMTKLITQLLKEMSLEVTSHALEGPVSRFCEDVEAYLTAVQADVPKRVAAPERTGSASPDVLLKSRDEFTTALMKHLKDPGVRAIQLITYTCEVERPFLEFYIKGGKTIEVFKRSILADLAEQQECNLRRLVRGAPVPRWHKRRASIQASEALASAAPPGSTIVQHLYPGPPTKRAFVFDGQEAVTAYYKVVPDTLAEGGSRYKGITEAPALVVTSESAVGSFVLDELANFIRAITRECRGWEEERRILLERAPWRGEGKRPCVIPRVALLDLDGILYDSLGDYVDAWRAAFRSIGVAFPEEEVYRQEGRRGRETIIGFLRKLGRTRIEQSTIEKVYDVKQTELGKRGKPKPQRGAEDLLRAISETELDIWVVTGSGRPRTPEWVEEDFQGLVKREHVITGEHVRAGKPDSDPFLLACQSAGVHPHESIVIENAPLGIESADRAGTFCIGVNTGVLADEELERAGARAVFESCSDLAQRWTDVITILKE